MKANFKAIVLTLCVGFLLFSTTSCIVPQRDPGTQREWHKNRKDTKQERQRDRDRNRDRDRDRENEKH
jgi:hypothetical protein